MRPRLHRPCCHLQHRLACSHNNCTQTLDLHTHYSHAQAARLRRLVDARAGLQEQVEGLKAKVGG
jgi:hypothetical protein